MVGAWRRKAEATSKGASLNVKKKEGSNMRTLSYFLESVAELDLALNIIMERIPCFADWYVEEPYIVATITCREEDAAFVEYMLAPFV